MIITKILITLCPSFKYFISAEIKERTLINLFSRLTIEETRIRTEERTKNIAFIANKYQCKKNFKKRYVWQIEQLAHGSIFLQKTYTKKILQRFRMENTNAIAIAADQNH